MGDIQWDQATCRGVKNRDLIFFPNSGRPKKVPPYKQFCDLCPIRYSCLSFAIVHDEEGIWGGMTKNERDSLGSQVKDRLTEEAKQQGWLQDRSDLTLMLDRLASQVHPDIPLEETPEVQEFDLPPEVWGLPSLEYFDLLENAEPPLELLHGLPLPPQWDVQPPCSDKNHFEDPTQFQFPPSPFDGINQNSTLQTNTA